MLIRLPNGRRYVIRDIRPEDKSGLTAGLKELTPETVFKRFLSPKHGFTAAELRYLTEVDGRDHVALVVTPLGRPDLICAVGRYVREADDPFAAEVAVVIADELQGQGLGKRLGMLLADRARANGFRRFTATMLGDNLVAHRLMRSISQRLVEADPEHGVHEVVAELAA